MNLGADRLNRIQPGLHAALEGRERVLGGGGAQFGDLAQFGDIGLERRLGEIGLELKRFVDRLGAHHGLGGGDGVFDRLLGIGIDFAVDGLDALAGDGGRLGDGIRRVLAVADERVITLEGLFQAGLQGGSAIFECVLEFDFDDGRGR